MVHAVASFDAEYFRLINENTGAKVRHLELPPIGHVDSQIKNGTPLNAF